MARVLLVDASFAAQPLHDFLVENGHDVWTIGARSHDPLAARSCNHLLEDYSDPSKVQSAIDTFKIDYLVPGCTDRSYASCVAVNQHGRFPGIDTFENFETISNKQAFRERARQLGLGIPKLLNPADCLDHLPIIIKPVDAFSGHGISILDAANPSALEAALENARAHSSTRTALIEQHVDGQLHSHSAFLANGRIVGDYVVTEHCIAEPFKVDVSWCTPNIAPSVLEQLRAEITTLATALDLVDGLIHTQFILSDQNIWLIEVARRCPGDLYSLLIDFSHEPAYCKGYTAAFLGERPPSTTPKELTSAAEPRHHVLRHTLSTPANQAFSGLQCKTPLPLKRYVPLALPGKKAGDQPERMGVAFYEFPDAGSLQEAAGRFLAGKACSTK